MRGGGGFHGGGGGGFHGGGGGFRGGTGFRGGFGRGFNGFGRGFNGRGFIGGFWPGFGWGWGGDYSPYWGYWDDPYAYGGGYGDPGYTSTYGAGYDYNPSPNVTVIYPANPQTAPVYTTPAVPVIRNYDQYGQEVPPGVSTAPLAPPSSSGSPIYLIATKDQAIRAAASYWVVGRTLHYVTLQHEEKTIPLDSLDRSLTMDLNRERRVPFQLPQ
jgi:hypothetical protein